MGPIPPCCPVDDAPHTTCTSADYVPRTPIVIVQLPCRDAAPHGPQTSPTPEPVETTFTTATYRRATHGRKTR